MVTLELEPEIEGRVRRLAKENHVSESFLIREALLQWLEDREDYAAGIQALSAMKGSISQDEMERRSNVAG
jgi:RHH-type rel operon transcriptional repressor/antitoxin RelB